MSQDISGTIAAEAKVNVSATISMNRSLKLEDKLSLWKLENIDSKFIASQKVVIC